MFYWFAIAADASCAAYTHLTSLAHLWLRLQSETNKHSGSSWKKITARQLTDWAEFLCQTHPAPWGTRVCAAQVYSRCLVVCCIMRVSLHLICRQHISEDGEARGKTQERLESLPDSATMSAKRTAAALLPFVTPKCYVRLDKGCNVINLSNSISHPHQHLLKKKCFLLPHQKLAIVKMHLYQRCIKLYQTVFRSDISWPHYTVRD